MTFVHRPGIVVPAPRDVSVSIQQHAVVPRSRGRHTTRNSNRITVERRTYNADGEVPGRRLPAKMERFACSKAIETISPTQEWYISAQLTAPSASIADSLQADSLRPFPASWQVKDLLQSAITYCRRPATDNDDGPISENRDRPTTNRQFGTQSLSGTFPDIPVQLDHTSSRIGALPVMIRSMSFGIPV